MELGFDPGIENVWVRLQHAGWCVMTVCVLAGLAGIFGRGPLATTSVSSPDGVLTVRYERYARFQTPSEITVQMHGGQALHRLHVSASALAALSIQSIEPRPQSQSAAASGIDFAFVSAAGTPSADVVLTALPKRAGLVSGSLTLDGVSQAPLHTMVWP